MSHIYEAIGGVITKVLSEWAFLLPEQLIGQPWPFQSDSPFLVSSLHFKGIINGTCYVICQNTLADLVGSNVLGVTPSELEEAERLDALKELVNILMGNLLTETYGADVVFDLTPPDVRVIGEDEAKKIIGDRAFYFAGDEEPLCVTFPLDGERNVN